MRDEHETIGLVYTGMGLAWRDGCEILLPISEARYAIGRADQADIPSPVQDEPVGCLAYIDPTARQRRRLQMGTQV